MMDTNDSKANISAGSDKLDERINSRVSRPESNVDNNVESNVDNNVESNVDNNIGSSEDIFYDSYSDNVDIEGSESSQGNERDPGQCEVNVAANMLANAVVAYLENKHTSEPKAQSFHSLPKDDESSESNNRQNFNKFPSPQPCSPTGFMKCSTFDGTTSLQDYLLQFELTAEYNGWDEREKALWLINSLRGVAVSVLSDLPAHRIMHYPSLLRCLEEEFGTKGRHEITRMLLRSRVRKPDESLVDLARDIKRMVKSGYPGADQRSIELFSVDTFLQAIPDKQLQRQVRAKDNLETLNDALKAAIKLEALDAYYSPEKIRKVVADSENPARMSNLQLQDRVLDLASVVGVLMEKVNQITIKPVPQKLKLCYFCNEPGHKKRHCPHIGRPNFGEIAPTQGGYC